MAKWMVAAKKADFDAIATKYHITPILARILRNRDLIEEEELQKFLYGELSDLHNPLLMKGMEAAVEIILTKIKEGAHIRVIGDYDVDGICATYILHQGIQKLGGLVDTVIPHRMKDGYGLNDSLIEAASNEGINLIITCDNGIAAASQIQLAKSLGMNVVVTDHHEIPYEVLEPNQEHHYILPEADAVVDPKQQDCTYPCKFICGAVVAYKLVQALLLKSKCTFTEDDFLPFAALATVCDVMELRDENRIIVREGLSRMEHSINLGLKALLLACGLEGKKLSPYHAGYILGPCLNASGRLDTAGRALKLFAELDWKSAVTQAEDLKSLNDSRKLMTETGVQEAIALVENTEIRQDQVLVIYLPECHESLAGIIAGRIKEKYGKPTFVLTKGEEGIKGSGRSIESYSMYEELNACKEFLTKFGGHKMAAGVALADESAIEQFRKQLNENCTLTQNDFEEIIHIDVPMPLSCADKAFVKELSLLEPFGTGNPKPLFARKGISLLSGKKIGKNRTIGKFKIAEEGSPVFDMIYFGDLEQLDAFLTEQFGADKVAELYQRNLQRGEMPISMAYYPELNVYAGQENIQIMMQSYC